MVDITSKTQTLREAVAEATVRVSREETMALIREGRVPKGNVLEVARVAGLLGIKKTPDLLPHCHPLPIEGAEVDFCMGEKEIVIQIRVRTIYKTGVEVEAMHGASVAALTLYDMLKPVDPGVEISTIRLVEKKGGKGSIPQPSGGLYALIAVCSDSVARGQAEDRSGELIRERLTDLGIACDKCVVPDETGEISRILMEARADLIVFSGGTGVGPRDVTPQAVEPLLDYRLPGVEEQMRRYGQDRMPFAMLSRSLVGLRGNQLVLVLPGSTRGVAECMDAVFPQVLHVFTALTGKRHDG